MPTHKSLLGLIGLLAAALEDHHTGTNTTRPFAETFERDKGLLNRARLNVEHAKKPRNIYAEALSAVQAGAVNSSGLINSLAGWLPQIWEDVDQDKGGTGGFNTHPVVQLIVSQLAFLTGLSLGLDTTEAEAKAEVMAAEFEAAR